jgi:hypothetical protein
MSTKEALIAFIRSLPDDVTPQDVAEKIAVKVRLDAMVDPVLPGPQVTHEQLVQIIDCSLHQLDNGEGIPHEEVVKRMAQWRQ